jgi:hypothetical protein
MRIITVEENFETQRNLHVQSSKYAIENGCEVRESSAK